MLNVLRSRLNKDEEDGFTLIELMVVVLIIAILIAIAIPTFLGARSRSQERAAQSSARNAVTAAKTMYTDDGNYDAADDSATGLSTVEPSLTYSAAATPSADEKTVSVSGAGDTFAAAVMSDSGTCYLVRDNASSTGGGTFFGETGTAANCTGTFAATPANTAGNEW
ncbi:MAG: prepilin-type N-terminal cleavage/methylation domain-containing protein [Acidimicrobiia bacterium]|nr:prepilin-type N-terminal cleavage/methylation domain-containing protein [Acidimicrobiia bacterium]